MNVFAKPPLSAAFLGAVGCLCLAGTAAAQHAAQVQRSERPPPACIEVQVNGERVPAYACLQRKLTPPTPTASPRPQLAPADRLMQTPGNALLQFNREGTHQRLGTSFGHSVIPQRPTP